MNTAYVSMYLLISVAGLWVLHCFHTGQKIVFKVFVLNVFNKYLKKLQMTPAVIGDTWVNTLMFAPFSGTMISRGLKFRLLAFKSISVTAGLEHVLVGDDFERKTKARHS